MADFRTEIDKAKQAHNRTMLQRDENDRIEEVAYAEFLVAAIKDRLLTVARDYLGEGSLNYTGFLLWEYAPEWLFERSGCKLRNMFSSINATNITLSSKGQNIYRRLGEILNTDGIDLCGFGFSRCPSLRSGDYFKVEPFTTAPATAPHQQWSVFVIDDFTAITPKDLPDRFQLPLTYRCIHKYSNFNGSGYSTDDFEVYEDGKRVFCGDSLGGISEYWKFTYNL